MYVHAHLIIGYGGSGGEMAESRLVPPQPFDFRKPDEWPRWLRRFEQYRVASFNRGRGEASKLTHC